jgi:phage tail sheath protein FI
MAAIPGFPASNTISPSVRIAENDLSFYQQQAVATTVGMVGFASKGPINQPTFITNQAQLNTVFGYPNPNQSDPYLLYAASQYLLTGNSLWVVRVAETNPTNPNYALTATVDAPASGLAVDVTAGSPNVGGFYVMDKDRFIRWRLNGILSYNILVIPYTNNVVGSVNKGSHNYTAEDLVATLNLQIIPEIDGIQFYVSTSGPSLAIRTLYSYGLDSSFEWVSVASMAAGGTSSPIQMGLGMTIGSTIGANCTYSSTSASVGNGVFDFSAAGPTPSLTVYVNGTNNANIDGVPQVIPLKTQGTNNYYTGTVAIGVILSDINYWINNPTDPFNSGSLVGGLEAVAGPSYSTSTSCPVSGPTTTSTTPCPLGNQLQFNTLTFGRDAQIYVKPSTIAQTIFGFPTTSGVGTTPVGLTSSFTSYCLGMIRGDANTTGAVSLTINASTPGIEGNSTTIQISNSLTEGTFQLQVFTRGVWVESWGNLTKNASATNYVTNQINLYSNYISIVDNTSVLAPPANTLNTPLVLSGGTDGMPADPGLQDELIIGNPLAMSGLFALGEVEQLNVDLIAAPGRTSTDVVLALINLSESVRRDCLAIIDPPFGFGVQEIIQWQNGQSTSNYVPFNSSFAALFWPWVVIYDTFNKKPVWVPPSGSILATMSRSDSLSFPWFAAAGLTRGVVPNIMDVFYRPTQAERDQMYGNFNCVNPIVQFAATSVAQAANSTGFYVWGNKTLQRRPTALDRVNVRRLMILVEKSISAMAKNLLFEPNDATTRASFVRQATTILQEIQVNRGIDPGTGNSPGFFVQCDEQLNPPAVVDRNEMRAKIGIKPVKALEFIFIEFTILAQGAIVTPLGTNI